MVALLVLHHISERRTDDTWTRSEDRFCNEGNAFPTQFCCWLSNSVWSLGRPLQKRNRERSEKEKKRVKGGGEGFYVQHNLWARAGVASHRMCIVDACASLMHVKRGKRISAPCGWFGSCSRGANGPTWVCNPIVLAVVNQTLKKYIARKAWEAVSLANPISL